MSYDLRRENRRKDGKIQRTGGWHLSKWREIYYALIRTEPEPCRQIDPTDIAVNRTTDQIAHEHYLAYCRTVGTKGMSQEDYSKEVARKIQGQFGLG